MVSRKSAYSSFWRLLATTVHQGIYRYKWQGLTIRNSQQRSGACARAGNRKIRGTDKSRTIGFRKKLAVLGHYRLPAQIPLGGGSGLVATAYPDCRFVSASKDISLKKSCQKAKPCQKAKKQSYRKSGSIFCGFSLIAFSVQSQTLRAGSFPSGLRCFLRTFPKIRTFQKMFLKLRTSCIESAAITVVFFQHALSPDVGIAQSQVRARIFSPIGQNYFIFLIFKAT